VAQIERDEIASTLSRWSLTFVEPDSGEASLIPEPWQPIVRSPDRQTRQQTALALWNREFLDLVPRFAAALATRFVDVRACLTDDCPVLVYVAQADSGGHVSWVGYDPGTFGAPPPFWDSFPGSLQAFLREVHAGFVSGSRTSFGPLRPRDMDTLANLGDFPEGIPGWEDDADISSTRLLRITTDGGLLNYCVSPDLAPGQVALVYEGDIDPQDLGSEVDDLLMSRLG
jgi:hypothetical protein